MNLDPTCDGKKMTGISKNYRQWSFANWKQCLYYMCLPICWACFTLTGLCTSTDKAWNPQRSVMKKLIPNTTTTICTDSAFRWATILAFHQLQKSNHKTVSMHSNVWGEKGPAYVKQPKQGPLVAYRPRALPQGQTGSVRNAALPGIYWKQSTSLIQGTRNQQMKKFSLVIVQFPLIWSGALHLYSSVALIFNSSLYAPAEFWKR